MPKKNDEKIAQFNRENVTQLRTKIQEVLASLGERYDVIFELGNTRFCSDSAKTTLKLKTKTIDFSRFQYRPPADEPATR
jgi:hypothetical protein